MNSIERKEKRYLRRKNKRLEKNISRSNLYGNINTAFCFHKVMYYADLCCKGALKGLLKILNFIYLQLSQLLVEVLKKINIKYLILTNLLFMKEAK